MKIGELARSHQHLVETIRYYEREGLLAALHVLKKLPVVTTRVTWSACRSSAIADRWTWYWTRFASCCASRTRPPRIVEM